ncbi:MULTISPECIES: exodeoxyribonuclease VII small subunit [Butyrivibrio]|jgi:exodeoxyribonuclease VII small subunit|uniref:exodeoxyribonuclease VII small subunit n=1 Tax=Butyrivibrio TaxID=830 RepID=UPI0004090D12|nr:MULTISPECIES: exodeoxyribonuclease VII small subunit [Butyrivibrio]
MAAKKEQKEKNNISVEEAFSKIEEKIQALEKDDISLDDSFKEYQEGMTLIKQCHEMIESVEKKVQKIATDGSLEDFD